MVENRLKALLVEDDALFQESVKEATSGLIQLTCAESQEKARIYLSKQSYDIVILDKHLANNKIGFDLIPEIRARHPHTVIIALTSDSKEESIIEAFNLGATDYLVKSNKIIDELRPRIHVAKGRVEIENRLKKAENQLKSNLDGEIVGGSSVLSDLKEQIKIFGPTSVNVLIQGETGTGKELVAKGLNKSGIDAKTRPFVAVNCAAFTTSLIESELFGHVRGSFTGAITDKCGKLELANGGDLFLDEVAELPLEVQAKFLRVLETGEFYRVGDEKPSYTKVRVISATHKNLDEMVKSGKFREDLLFRINSITIHTVPLRERSDDLRLLAIHFTKVSSQGLISISDSVIDYLTTEEWKGNVRELKHRIEIACVVARAEQRRELHSQDFLKYKRNQSSPSLPGLRLDLVSGRTLNEIVNNTKKTIVNETVKRFGGDIKEAARALDINTSTLYNIKGGKNGK